MITVAEFDRLPPDRDHPERAEAIAAFDLPDGTTETLRISLFMLEDGRIGIGAYPTRDRGAVMRWDNGPANDPRIIYWESPMTAANSPMYAQGIEDAETDNQLVADGEEPIGPQPPNPDYPVMYMKGYEKARKS